MRGALPLPLRYLLLLIAGAAMVLTYAPYSVHWSLPFLLIAVLYILILDLTPRQGLFAGWLFGLGYFGLCVNWVYNSIHLFGSAAAPLAGAVTLLFVLVMTVFPMLTAWLFLKFKPSIPWYLRALLFASIWVLLELARGKIMGGFPWVLVGYSQTTETVGSLAPFVGVYGLSFFVVFVACAAVDVIVLHWSNGVRARVLAFASCCVLGVLMWFGLATLNKVEFSEPTGDSVYIRMVQANIPQELKFSQERLITSLEQYTALSQESLPDTDLIIWPETAIPTYFSRVENVIEPFANRLLMRGTEVLSGGFYSDENGVYNSVRQLSGEKALYKKRHLVPFGEYMPFRFLLNWLNNYIEIPMSDLGKGTGANVPLNIKGIPVGITICYEDVFGEEMRELIPAATLMVNVSNDAWFGEKIAPYQHQQKAQMRARELARPLVRVTNTGVSSSISYRGQLEQSIPHNTKDYRDIVVQPRSGTTPYARTGNWPVFILSMLVLFLVGFVSMSKRSATKL